MDNKSILCCDVCTPAIAKNVGRRIESSLAPIVGDKANCSICGLRCSACGFVIWRADAKEALSSSLERIGEAVRPIPVTERLPEELCLVYCRGTESYFGLWCEAVFHPDSNLWFIWFSRDKEWDEFSCDGRGYEFKNDGAFITHWLPQPPKPE